MGQCGFGADARNAACVALAIGLASCAGDESGDRPNFGNPNQPAMAGAGGGGRSGGIGNVGNPGGPAVGVGGTGPRAGSGTGTSGSGSDEECATATVHTSIATPVILFVVDGSGSMCETFGGSTRWQALRTALLDPTNGLVYKLQGSVVFGTMIYDGTIDFMALASATNQSPAPECAGMYTAMKATGECPQLIQVAPALNNAPALDAAFPATELGGSTPTHKAMEQAVNLLETMVSTNPDMPNNPLYIILATDGAPNDICMGSMGSDSAVQQQQVIAQVDRAAALKIKTFVVSLAGADMALQSHLEVVADHGQPMNMDAKAFSPMAPEELVNTLSLLIGGAIGCEVQLNGTVTMGRECLGKVQMNGNPLPCCKETAGAWTCNDAPVTGDQASGWRLKDPRTVELVGAECVAFTTAREASLEARFPCDVFSPD
jgi:Mg-chelatase subunit ChlD